MANAILCSQFKKNSNIYRKNQHHLHVCQTIVILNSINDNFLHFCIQKFEIKYTNMPSHKKFFWSSKKKMEKDKVSLNHVVQN